MARLRWSLLGWGDDNVGNGQEEATEGALNPEWAVGCESAAGDDAPPSAIYFQCCVSTVSAAHMSAGACVIYGLHI